ncbi:C-type lectin BpLec-like [Macrochelys suwanniensis]
MPQARPLSHAGCTWTDLAPEQLPSETIRGSEKMGPVAYFSLCLLGCLIFNPSLAGVQAVACPRDWLPFQDDCYRYFSQAKNWTEAEVECKQQWRGAHLASIHSAGENNMLAHSIEREHKSNNPVWIGLSDPQQDLSWKWTDHSLYNYKAWDKGQPKNFKGIERCTGSYPRKGFPKWYNHCCDYRLSFICKQNPRGDSSPAPGGSQHLVCE